MPSPIAAVDLIASSMRLGQIIASGEPMTADEANDALAVLNDILENWSTQPLAVWGAVNQSFATVGGQATYTIGAGGNLNTARPERINSAYGTWQGLDTPIEIIPQSRYNAIGLKTQPGDIAEQLLYVNDMPLGRITLWPVPTQAGVLTLSTDTLLTAIPTLATVITYPKGGAKALRYRLAVELQIEFGVVTTTTPLIVGIAAESMADYKRVNKKPIESSIDPSFGSSGLRYADWRRGY